MSVFEKTIFTSRKSRKPENAPDDDDEEEPPKNDPPPPPSDSGKGGNTGNTSNNANSSSSGRPEATEEVIPPEPFEGRMPTYFHIGRFAKECLTVGYKIGKWHIDCTTQASDECTLYNYGTAKPDHKTISGGVGIREMFGMLNLTQVWQTDGAYGTIGVSTDAGGGIFNAMLRAAYATKKRPGPRIDFHVGYEQSPFKVDVIVPILKVPKLMGYVLLQPAENYLLGFRIVYDVNKLGFDKHVIALGYSNDNTEVGFKLENLEDVRGSIFQRLGEDWAVGLKSNKYHDEDLQFAIGFQYKINDDATIKAKIRDDGYLGMVFQHRLSESINIMYHIGCDVKSPVDCDHKFGISWSLIG